MTDSEKRFVEYWKKKRAGGKYKFWLITGITYGIFVVVFSKVFAWNAAFIQKDLSYAVISLIMGVMALGPFMWWHRERKYHKIISKNPSKKKKQQKT
jgi:hypothetical protein